MRSVHRDSREFGDLRPYSARPVVDRMRLKSWGFSRGSLLVCALGNAMLNVVLVNGKETGSELSTARINANPAEQGSILETVFGSVMLIWYVVVVSLGYSGWVQIERKFSQKKRIPRTKQPAELEPVSILRPCKGIDTEMMICLESCVNQDYPRDKFEVIFCVENSMDSSIPIIQQLLDKYPEHQLSLLIGDNNDYFGPNPKINNLAKGYRMARYDILWVLDSNVWCSPGTLARSVDSLTNSLDNGSRTSRPVVLTHHVPLGVSISADSMSGRLDEMFLFSSHAKFYVAFNYVSIAPCVNGKSNLYRRSHLETAVQMIGDRARTSAMFANADIQDFARRTMNKSLASATVTRVEHNAKETVPPSQQGRYHALEFFSTYIGEDNMIGAALWDMLRGRTGMTRDVVVQPHKSGSGDDSYTSYIARRVRWLRVRKYMVLAATLLEPTTECLLVGAMGTYGLVLTGMLARAFVPCALVFLSHVTLWCASDWIQYKTLCHNTVDDDAGLQHQFPRFIPGLSPRRLADWLPVWLLRELLALPIWIKAMCGSVIQWRNRPFRIKPDLTAEEL